MYAGVGSNVCVTNVGHTMFTRVGDVYSHVGTQGQAKSRLERNQVWTYDALIVWDSVYTL